jgi:phosphate transport system substrate-binding protein
MSRRGFSLFAVALVAALAASVGATGALGSSTTDVSLNGAGSTFINPLVQSWIPAMNNLSHINSVSYQAIGSGAGIAAITSRSVDFGASDAPLTPDQQTSCDAGGSKCLMLPWAFGGTAFAYHGGGLPKGLRITGDVLAKIYMGQITNWNDKAIHKLNPSKTLPNKPIVPVWRNDSSGTSYNITEYLSTQSKQFKTKIGIGTLPSFTVGVGGHGSSGVLATVLATDGSIGYFDVAYTLHNHLSSFAVRNAAGKYLTPTLKSITAATKMFSKAPKATANGIVLHSVNPSKKYPAAYPITTFTYIIVAKKSGNASGLKTVLGWAMTKGQAYAPGLVLAPMPVPVQNAAVKLLKTIHT